MRVADASGGVPVDDPAPTPQEIAEMSAGILDPAQVADLGLNVSQSKNLGWAMRMLQAEEVLRRLEKQGTRMWPRLLEMLPGTALENQFFSPEYQQYVNAREAFSNAALRADTGAQINESEIPRMMKEFMPLPGDDAETLAQRRRSREAFLRAVIAATGPAATLLPQPGSPVIPIEEMSDDDFLKSLGIE